jgi:oligosaccharide repeat unit polymerase
MNKSPVTLSLICICIFVELLIYTFLEFDFVDPTTSLLAESGVVLFVEYLLLYFVVRSVFGGFLNFFSLFFIMIGVTHIVTSLIFSLDPFPADPGWFVDSLISNIPKKNFILANGLLSFCLPALVFGAAFSSKFGRYKTIYGPLANAKSARSAAITIFFVSLPAFFVTLQHELTLVRSGGYQSLFVSASSPQQLNTWFIQMAVFLPISGYYLLSATKSWGGKNTKYGMAIIMVSAFSEILLGRRTEFIMPILAYFWIKKKITGSVSLGPIFLVSLLLIIATPVVVFWRATGSVTGLAGAGSSLFTLIESIFNNLGVYYYFIGAIIKNFPSKFDYTYFDSFVSAIAYCVPNIGGFNSTHVGYDQNIVYWLGNTYFTTENGAFVETGYSFLGEIYQSFGPLGVVPISLLVGVVLGKLTKWSESAADARSVAFFASIIQPILFYPRDVFVHVLRPILWYSLLSLLLAYFYNSYRSSKAQVTKMRDAT